MLAILERFVESVHASLTAEEPERLLRQFVRAHVVWRLEQREQSGAYTASIGMRDLVHSLPPKHRRDLISKQRRHLDTLRRILEDGVAQGVFHIESIRVTSFAIVTMCDYAPAWYDPDGDLSPDEIADLYATLVCATVGGTALDMAAAAPSHEG
jgi:hypothetical protein